LKELERENRELKRANEILRKASAFFAQAELDRQSGGSVANPLPVPALPQNCSTAFNRPFPSV
jgi:hypothetical protein